MNLHAYSARLDVQVSQATCFSLSGTVNYASKKNDKIQQVYLLRGIVIIATKY